MIDWKRVNALREEVGAEDFDEVVELFLEEVDCEIETLQTARSEGHLSEKLHFLKGSALSLGFRQFSGLCKAGEAALSGNVGASVDLAELLACYRQSREEFLSKVAEMTSA